jgi:arylsulfatase A-like enzyme
MHPRIRYQLDPDQHAPPEHAARVERVVLVILDGLRPDAIDRFALPHLTTLIADSAWTRSARTVAPSITVAAMASLLTGVAPEQHGVLTERFRLPRRRTALAPLPLVLAEAGYPSSAFLSRLPPIHRVLTRHVIRSLGPVEAHFAGRCARDILAEARDSLRTRRRGFTLLHWPDADDAGHDHGWMSAPYAAGARALDAALGTLLAELDLAADPSTLLIVAADHGGGGTAERDHESDHPADRTVPVILAGARVSPGPLPVAVSLLDIPPTILWSLGVPIPDSYIGLPLRDALTGVRTAAAA